MIADDRTFKDVVKRFDWDSGLFKMRVRRIMPEVWENRPIFGHLESFTHLIDEAYINNHFGGGVYEVDVMGDGIRIGCYKIEIPGDPIPKPEPDDGFDKLKKICLSVAEEKLLNIFLEDLFYRFGNDVCADYSLENTPEFRDLIIKIMEKDSFYGPEDIKNYRKEMEVSGKECSFSSLRMIEYLMNRLREVGILPKKEEK